MARIASLLVPLFPLAARLRSEPELAGEAVVIVEGNGNAAHVIAASRRARRETICAGMTLPQARALLPKLIARGRDAECERTSQEALLEIAERFSPRIEDAGEGVAHLDVSGMEGLFRDKKETTAEEGPADHETTLARAIIQAAGTAGLPTRVGIAASKLAARIAAELPKSPVIVPPGEESAFLAPLPLTRLLPELAIGDALGRWGIRSIGELARLPEAEVASRLGETGRALHWAARGVDSRPLTPRLPPPEFREGMDLEWPLVSLEPFLFIANAALDRLARRMEVQGFACRRLELLLKLEPDGYDSRGIDLPAPTRDVKTMLTLIRLGLEARTPGAPVAGFSFVAHPDRPRRAQLSLFGSPALSPDKLATTIARLAALIGSDRVGTPVTVDGHAPERFAIVAHDPPPPPELRRRPRRSRGLLAVRVLRPPVPVEVIMRGNELHSVQPLAVRNDSGDGSKRMKIEGSIRVASGPWSLEEGWWCEKPVDRDYWDVELSSGGVYRIYRERGEGGWYVDGMYD
ncbi:MAG TPA: DNA polymerase Y family protein [Thermoanaerobaculia bacterium]|nr:DNA polymerase Y family protein [Thermoanaerobaculia bacterium]